MVVELSDEQDEMNENGPGRAATTQPAASTLLIHPDIICFISLLDQAIYRSFLRHLANHLIVAPPTSSSSSISTSWDHSVDIIMPFHQNAKPCFPSSIDYDKPFAPLPEYLKEIILASNKLIAAPVEDHSSRFELLPSVIEDVPSVSHSFDSARDLSVPVYDAQPMYRYPERVEQEEVLEYEAGHPFSTVGNVEPMSQRYEAHSIGEPYRPDSHVSERITDDNGMTWESAPHLSGADPYQAMQSPLMIRARDRAPAHGYDNQQCPLDEDEIIAHLDQPCDDHEPYFHPESWPRQPIQAGDLGIHPTPWSDLPHEEPYQKDIETHPQHHPDQHIVEHNDHLPDAWPLVGEHAHNPYEHLDVQMADTGTTDNGDQVHHQDFTEHHEPSESVPREPHDYIHPEEPYSSQPEAESPEPSQSQWRVGRLPGHQGSHVKSLKRSSPDAPCTPDQVPSPERILKKPFRPPSKVRLPRVRVPVTAEPASSPTPPSEPPMGDPEKLYPASSPLRSAIRPKVRRTAPILLARKTNTDVGHSRADPPNHTDHTDLPPLTQSSPPRVATARVNKPFRPPTSASAFKTPFSRSTAPSPASSKSQRGKPSAAAEIHHLEDRVRELRSAVRYHNEPEEDDRLVTLINTWREAGRTVAELLYQRTPKPDPSDNAWSAGSRNGSSGPWNDEPADGGWSGEMLTDEQRACLKRLTVNDNGDTVDAEGNLIFPDPGEDDIQAMLRVGPRTTLRDAKDDDTLSFGSSSYQVEQPSGSRPNISTQWSVGALMMRVGVDPALLGWNDEEEDWRAPGGTDT